MGEFRLPIVLAAILIVAAVLGTAGWLAIGDDAKAYDWQGEGTFCGPIRIDQLTPNTDALCDTQGQRLYLIHQGPRDTRQDRVIPWSVTPSPPQVATPEQP